MVMEHRRNTTLDLLKLLAAYMVVFIHVRFYGKTGVVMDGLARFAVPLFFVASGYFSYQLPLPKIKSRLRHIIRLLIVAVLAFVLWRIKGFIFDLDLAGLYAYIDREISVKKVKELLVYNVPIFSVNLWYLYAMIYVYIIFYFTTKYAAPDKLVFATASVLLVLHLLLGEFLSCLGIVLKEYYLRNFALMGIPFFGMGLMVRKYEGAIHKIPNYVVVLDCVGGRCSDEEEIVLQYFMDRGYEEVVKENQIIVLRSEVR